MPNIPMADLDIFKETTNPLRDNFTQEEVTEISKLARTLKVIIDATKERQQDQSKLKPY